MTMHAAANALIVLALCLVSGVADARGFIHASRMWRGDDLAWAEFGRSALGFVVGIGAYWLSLRYMQRLEIVSPTVQTTVWFVVTIVGVALASGQFVRWPTGDQFVAAGVVVGLGWLLYRTAESV